MICNIFYLGKIKDKEKTFIYEEEFVVEVLLTNDIQQLDVEGAGEFLPEHIDSNLGEDMGTGTENVVKDTATIVKKKKNKIVHKNPIKKSEDSEGIEPIMGEVDENGEKEVSTPTGHNKGKGNESHPGGERENANEELDKKVASIFMIIPVEDSESMSVESLTSK